MFLCSSLFSPFFLFKKCFFLFFSLLFLLFFFCFPFVSNFVLAHPAKIKLRHKIQKVSQEKSFLDVEKKEKEKQKKQCELTKLI